MKEETKESIKFWCIVPWLTVLSGVCALTVGTVIVFVFGTVFGWIVKFLMSP